MLLVRFSPYLFYPIRILYIEFFHTRFRHLRLLVISSHVKHSELGAVDSAMYQALSTLKAAMMFFSHPRVTFGEVSHDRVLGHLLDH